MYNMKIKHQLSIATLVMAGVFATGCSQQSAGGSQVAGGSQQSAGGSQVSGGSQQQVEGGSQVASGGSQQAGSQQQVEEAPVVAPVAKPTPRVVPRPTPKMAPRPAGNCHGHAANARTKSMRHCHPNPTASHRYGGQKRATNNQWGHTHPAVPRCTKSVRHTHKYNSANHSHKYSCQGMAPAPRAAKQPVDVYALQRKLKAKGYYKGPIDGVVGSGTRSALKRFMNR